MFDENLDDSEDDTNEVELLLPRRETKQQAELRRSNARKRSRVALGCACNILNGTLGPGMLVLPLAFRRTGLGYGIALLVADWALSYLALRLLLDACAHTPAELVKSARRPQATQPAGSKEWVAFPRARPANSRRGAPLPSRRKVCPKRAALLCGSQAPHEPRTARPRPRAEDVHVRRLVGRALLLRHVHILPHPRRWHVRPPAPLLLGGQGVHAAGHNPNPKPKPNPDPDPDPDPDPNQVSCT